MKVANPTAKKGEEFAEKHLRKIGYKVISRNFRKGYGEIDIVAIDNSEKEKVLVFIEVKTRMSDRFGSPFEAITPWKLRSLVKTAQFYKLVNRNLPDSMRIDAISILLSNSDQVEKIEHIKNISA